MIVIVNIIVAIATLAALYILQYKCHRIEWGPARKCKTFSPLVYWALNLLTCAPMCVFATIFILILFGAVKGDELEWHDTKFYREFIKTDLDEDEQ